MTLKQIGRIALVLYGVAIVVGVIYLFQFSDFVGSYSTQFGGGLALLILLGLLGLCVVALVGAVAIGIIGWVVHMIIATAEERSSPEGKRNLKWLVLGIVIVFVGSIAFERYTESEKEAEEKTAQEVEQSKARDADELARRLEEDKCNVQKGWMLGKWARQTQTTRIYIEFEENDVVIFSGENVPQITGSWGLDCRDMTLSLNRATDAGTRMIERTKIVYVDHSRLHVSQGNQSQGVSFLRVE